MFADSRIAHYRITGKLGEGGMGVVYRATDSRLGREVAIKVLPPSMAGDPDRLARFEREARLLAGLDHPNIGAIYGIEQSGGATALVLALIEGPTLADRIAAGPIALEEAVAIARQIAEALEYAHERGIIHRDLKPANIKITPDGTVKILDFGLARALTEESTPAANPTISPTLSMRATQAGMILGTAAYMAPEQANGKAADRRADIWAFGIILLEMLTGRPVFGGESIAEVLASSIKDAPPLDRLPAATPSTVRRLIARCLEKDPRQRLQAIGEARIALSAPFEETTTITQPAAIPARASKLPWAVAAALLLGLAALAFRHFREQPSAAPTVRFQVSAPDGTQLGPYVSVSPDGRRLAFRVRDEAGYRIWIRSLDSLEAHSLAGTEGGNTMFWSPDSRYLVFAARGKLKEVEAAGGPVQTLAELSAPFVGGAWAPDGTILVAFLNRGLHRMPASGGTPIPAVASDPNHPVFAASPSLLPDGRHYIYTVCTALTNPCTIHVRALDTQPQEKDSKPLVTIPSKIGPLDVACAYAPSPDPDFGYILFERESSLMALPFDARRLEVAGPAVSVAEGIGSATRSYSVSANGVLAFQQSTTGSSAQDRLLWFDRQGKPAGQLGPPGPYSAVSFSPDGRFAAIGVNSESGAYSHNLAVDLARGVFTRINPGETIEYAGVISPDGRVAFTYTKNGAAGDIYVRSASGAGEPEPLVVSPLMKHPNDWSRDGRWILYDEHGPQKQDLLVVSAAGGKPIPFLATPADESPGAFSPDTRWVAYSSDESGRREVYVQGFVPDHVPAAGILKVQLSVAGGDKPRWRRDGREIYYIAPDGKMMAVPVSSTATTFSPGVPVPLFQVPRTIGYAPYDVAPDGRFLFAGAAEETPNRTSPISVVLNWWPKQ
jgi:serine/threonine protein kinase/Tol biopolymer transport system component